MRIRTALAALASVATLATVGVASAATSASASTTTTSHGIYTPRPATVADLSATLTIGHKVHGNQRELILTLTNKSPRPVTISGYPGLLLLNARHWPLPTTTTPVFSRIPVPAKIVLFPGRSVTSEITFAVYGRYHPWNWNPSKFPFYGASATYLVVTLPNSHQPSWQRFTLKIPGGPVQIVQNRLYETALVGTSPVHPW